MSKICLPSNFKREQHSGSLDFTELKSTKINDIIEEIYDVLKGKPFSTSKDSSQDPDNYIDSISDLVDFIGEKLEKEAPKKLNPTSIENIKNALKQKLMPAPLTKVESAISAVIAGTDLVKQDEIDKMRYNKVIQSFYGQSNISVDNWRLRNFEDALGGATVLGEDRIVDNDLDLNENVINYQESQYQIIRNYLKQYCFKDDFPSDMFPVHYYTNSRIDPSVKIQTSNSQNTFTAMYNVINHVKNSNEFKNMLEKGWNDDIMNIAEGSQERDFFKAVAAYLNLVYFDETLKGSNGNFISIHRQDMPVEVIIDNYDNKTYSFKYTIQTGNTNAIKTWGVEDSDAIKQMSNFNKFLINRIPLYDTTILDTKTKSPTKQFMRLEVKDFVGTMSKLIEIGSNSSDSKFAKDCSSLINNNSLIDGPLTRIFNKLFKDRDNKTITKELKDKGFDINNFNILYSIYHTVFDKSNKSSWYNLENNYRAKTGFRSRYNLVENVYGIICSNAALNYLNTTYNSETGEYETKVKEKYSINSIKFDIKNSINDITRTKDNKDREEILDKYELTKLDDGLSYKIKIGNNEFIIQPKSNKDKQINILSKKKASSSDYKITGLEKFDSIDLSGSNNREEIFSAKNGINYEFKELLNFIGTTLDINFANSVSDLNELNLAMSGDKNFLKDIFISSVRALVVNDIYKKFSEATKSDGTSYAKTELVQYMEDTGEWPSVVSADGLEASEYFDKTEIAKQLNVVHVNESWVTRLSRVRAILAQDTVTSVITDLSGNKNPNVSPTYLNSTQEIKNQISISNADTLNPTSNLLFSRNRNALLNSTVNLDVQTSNYDTKQIKGMTQQELIYDAIINKFFIPLLNDNSVYTQCTTQSDKTKFIATHVDMNALGLGKSEINKDGFENRVLTEYIGTIGRAYKGVYSNVLQDYKTVFPELDSIEKINAALQGRIPVKSNGEDIYINTEKNLIKAVNLHNKNNPDNKVVFYKDLSYRVISNGLAFNELLYDYANNLYKNESTLAQRFQLEKRKFLNNLMNNQVYFKATPQLKNLVSRLFGPNYSESWIEKHGNEEYLILAKSKEKSILFGKVEESDNITLNPLLNTYFLLDNLVGNNLRFASTGSEINHKIKALKKLDLRNKLKTEISISNNEDILRNQLNELYDPSQNITFYDLNSLKNILQEKIGTNPEYTDLYNIVNRVYNSQVYAMENLGQNAQFKRNVIMSATMTKMVPSLEGITDSMKIACIDDIGAKVFNFSGKRESVDAHDGSALVNGLWSILENKSLGSNEVGNIKKPIHHSYDNKYMSATLLKYATNAITNNWMRQSIGNDLNDTKHAINLHQVFKKMCNTRWHDESGNERFGKIDLVKGCEFKKDKLIDFANDILGNDVNKNNQLYYKRNGENVRIIDFGSENGVYYTIEQAYNNSPEEVSGQRMKVYHYFDNNSVHHSSNRLLTDAELISPDYKLHTIDSLFELHTALGGIWSERWNGTNYEYSEGSMLATVNFINNVATFKTKEGEDPKEEKERRKDISIANYDQPLKRAMIHMLANNSAVKNGVGNINPSTSWYDDSDFSYIEISTNNYGIQQDSDHTADEAHMTEFSQVISSLDAGGQLHDYVSQIYEELGQTALNLAKVELDSVKQFRDTGDKSILYDVLGRTIMANMRSGDGSIGLADAIMSNIKKKFNINTNHDLDSLKIPFSDPNIYSQIISTFVSNLNKKSIKRQYPGLGTVMAPSYNMSMIFDVNIDGEYQQYQFMDLVKLANERHITSELTDVTKANQDRVKKLLQQEQDKVPEQPAGAFLPTDNVLVKFETPNATGELEVAEAHLSFKEGDLDYYEFQKDQLGYLRKKGYSIPDGHGIKLYKDLTVPRNLAPARIEFDYTVDGKDYHSNIFNSYRVRNQIIELKQISDNLEGSEKEAAEKAVRDKYKVDDVFTELKNGEFELEDGRKVKIRNLKNQAAEIIMSNLYATKFGIKSGDSLVDVLKKGKNYFKIPELGVASNTYDMAFVRGDGDHLFLTFKPLQSNTDTFKSRSKDWSNINKVSYKSKYDDLQKDSPKVVNRIYACTSDNIRLFEVGREIINNNISWDEEQKCFVQNGKKVDNQKKYRRNGNDILEYIEFVSKHEVTETFEKGIKKTYTLYNINRQNIQKCLEYRNYTAEDLANYTKDKDGNPVSKELQIKNRKNFEVNDFISNLLTDIYSTDSFSGVDVNDTLTAGSRAVLNNTLYGFSEKLSFDPLLKKYLKDLASNIRKAQHDESTGLYKFGYKKLRTKYYIDLRDKQFISFKKSLDFTVARIPAQTLQSFMKMKNVGFTGTKTGQCFVTAWQTWLQGSDYDIDKAYVMGLSFDTIGKYLGWSNLFNYKSTELLEASEKLPMPRGIIHFVTTDERINNIKESLQEAIHNKDEDGINTLNFWLEKASNAINLDEDIEKIQEAIDAKDELKEMNLYVNLINKLNKKVYKDFDGTLKVNIRYTNPKGLDVLKKLKLHENTKLPQALAQEVSKNFISSHIQNTVQDLTNMTRAYSPIEMELFRDASKLSDKGDQSSGLTLLDPFCKFIMQYQNMTGKNVIGISANGEKGSFMWHYYLNDLIRHGSPEERKMGHFQFNSNRIVGRSLAKLGIGDIQSSVITGLPDLNMEGVDPAIQQEFGNRITGNLYVDLMISQVLSAATDNAKELILAKVNAGSKLAKMYLFMITLGYNINDIVAFMTSPVADFIDKVTEQDVFNNTSLSVKEGIQLAKGDFLDYQGNIKYKWKKRVNSTLKMEMIKDLYFRQGLGIKTDPNMSEEEKELLSKKHEDILADIAEFENILEGANEFSNFASFLGMNQGIKTSKLELQKFENKIKNYYNDRLKNYKRDFSNEEKALVDEIGDFDVKKWFYNKEYRDKVALVYNKIKKCINLFDAFTRIPQFDAIREIYDTVGVVDNESGIKSESFNKCIEKLNSINSYSSEKYQNNILKQIENNIIKKYIYESNIEIPVNKDWSFLQSDGSLNKFAKSSSFSLKDRASIATFKYLMESTIIPGLKRGSFISLKEDGKVNKSNEPSLKNNYFISSLKPTVEQNNSFYKCDLNMLTIKQSLDSQRKYQQLVSGLRDLNNIQITPKMTLADMFMLYNLIVNKNQYGASRMTSLFDPIVNSSNNSLLSDYLKKLGELDYFGKSRLQDEEVSKGQTLELNTEDIFKEAAPLVKSLSNQSDLYVKLMTNNVVELYQNTGGKGQYSKVSNWVNMHTGEDQNNYIERIQNLSKHFTLGGTFSDLIEQKLSVISNLDTPDKVISCLNDFVKQGLLVIRKVCE